MKLTVIGAAGVRTPLIVKECYRKAESLGLTDLFLMDIDGEHLELIDRVTESLLTNVDTSKLKRTITTDPRTALQDADFVITTFRVGGIEARVIDERVPLSYGVLGQETTGAGGFSMGLRSIPVLLGYIDLMRQYCPNAWLINFANPSGMMAEAAIKAGHWERTIGICDAPTEVQRLVSQFFGIPEDDIFVDYFGLNHLGWTKSIRVHGKDILPKIISEIDELPIKDMLPYSTQIVKSLGMLPNEYLYYFYNSKNSVQNILRSEHTRGEEILEENEKFFKEISRIKDSPEMLLKCYTDYLEVRRSHYMQNETGKTPAAMEPITLELQGGYADVALRLIKSLQNGGKQVHIVNTLNKGAIKGLPEDCVVEVPSIVGHDFIQPVAVGDIPLHALGLLARVKAYEQLTIQAAVEGSEEKAVQALVLHPLVADEKIAAAIVKDLKAAFGKNYLKGIA